MNKTVLITGASSGIGKAASKYFAEHNWNVAATMRNPQYETDLVKSSNLKLYKLDVTDSVSIQTAIKSVVSDFGKIDAVINNAGYGTVGIFEKSTPEQIQKQFDVNVFGVMSVIRNILPHFKQNGSGTIINITSVGGLITFPLYSVYHATKWAVEGFTESLIYELSNFNIKVKLVEPGAIKTDFYSRSQDLFNKEGFTEYDKYENHVLQNMQKVGAEAVGPEIVAKTIYKAANDNSNRLRYAVGSQAPLLAFLRRILPNSLFFKIIKSAVEKGLK